MHELGIMNDVLETALRVAEQNGGKKVTKISLNIGVVSGVLPQYVQSFFDVISKDTAAAGAQIDIERDPAVYRCLDCGETSACDEIPRSYVCRRCGSKALRLLSGYGFHIVSVAII